MNPARLADDAQSAGAGAVWLIFWVIVGIVWLISKIGDRKTQKQRPPDGKLSFEHDQLVQRP